MPTNPSDVALQGHRYEALVGNASRNANIHMTQALDFSWRKNVDQEFELGNTDVVATGDDPLEPSATIQRATVGDLAIETILAVAAIDATSVSVGTIFTKDGLKVLGPVRNSTGTVTHERQMLESVVSDISYNMNAAGVITESFTLDGTTLTTIDSGMQAWQAEEAATHRVIKGRDAIVTIGGSNDEDDIVWRIQTFNIRAAGTSTKVNELGNRNLAGVVSDPPLVSLDFEVLEADIEPDKLLTGNAALGTAKDFNTPSDLDVIVRIYNPADSRAALGSAETATPLKSFKLDNCRLISGGIRSQVRGMGSKRYSMVVTSADTAGTGGLTIFAGDVV